MMCTLDALHLIYDLDSNLFLEPILLFSSHKLASERQFFAVQ